MGADAGKGAMPQVMGEAYLLAGIGGFIDAFGILTLGGLFVAHMSGNSAALGAAFGQGQWGVGMPHLVAIPIFVLGLFCGYVWMLRAPGYRRCAAIFLLEAALLAGFGVAMAVFGSGVRNTPHYFALAALPLFAMGLQNATLREVGRSVFATTYMTGVLDAMAKSAAHWVLRSANSDRLQVQRACGMWGGYVVGAIAGSAGQLIFDYKVLAIPVVCLLVLAVRFWTTDRRQSAPAS